MQPRFIALAAIMGVASVFVLSRSAQAPLPDLMPRTSAAATMEERTKGWVVASGIVEPVTKELVLGFETSGVIDTVFVAEGDLPLGADWRVRPDDSLLESLRDWLPADAVEVVYP